MNEETPTADVAGLYARGRHGRRGRTPPRHAPPGGGIMRTRTTLAAAVLPAAGALPGWVGATNGRVCGFGSYG